MAFFYLDTDGSGALAPYDTWAKAAQDTETVLGAMSAGDTLYVQGLAADTAAASRTLTSPGTLTNPCKIIGVKNGTTNTGTSIVTSDLVAKGDADVPHIEITGAGNDMTFAGIASCFGLELTAVDRMQVINELTDWYFTDCTKNIGGVYHIQDGRITNINTDVVGTSTGFQIWTRDNIISNPLRFYGGTYDATTSADPICHSTLCDSGVLWKGVDISSAGSKDICGTGSTGEFELINCKMSASTGLTSGTPTFQGFSIVAIQSSADTSVSNTGSIQDYSSVAVHGTIDLEQTIVRTGGADDDATGGFSYAMSTHANSTLEGSAAKLSSPWFSVWVDGGASKTLTVYICNSTASTDYNEDETYCEFYTPDAGDTAQFDQTFNPGTARILDSSTAVTDDTGSTWGSGGNNHQKFSATVTPGYEGFAYARVHLLKRQATPDTLYLDPAIVVT